MPKYKPATAAKRIIDIIDRGEASSAEDAIGQNPDLEPGRKALRDALGEELGKKGGRLKRAASKVTGSGSAILER